MKVIDLLYAKKTSDYIEESPLEDFCEDLNG